MTRFSEASNKALDNKGQGSITDLANVCLISTNAVDRWRKGECLPMYIRWEEIEEYLDWAPGTIEKLASQDLQRS